jgi:beta-aspartyl-dipeptidase (metallo-type)
MITRIRGGRVFAPEPMGRRDIVVAGGRVVAVREPGTLNLDGLEIADLDASDCLVVPGFVDSHVHILGGGGEGGPATRAPEIRIEDIIAAGVTTVVGCLGTDGTTRHMESLLAKARALEIEGISTFLFSGSYEVPVRTLTGSVRSDLVFIDKIIGAGEIALSDHRSSQPSFGEFARLAADCRVGGMLGGKAGVLHCHLGDGPKKLDYFFRLLAETEIPPSQVIGTHINRSAALFGEGLRWVRAGGTIDLTAGPDPDPSKDPDVTIEDCVRAFRDEGLPLGRLTITSDANGSIPVFDKAGTLVGLTIATERDLFRKFRDLVGQSVLRIEEAIRPFSTNPAEFYKLARKGRIAEDMDADLLILTDELELNAVIAGGRVMMRGGRLEAKGTFSSRAET